MINYKGVLLIMHVSCSINYLESTHKNIDSSRKLSIRWLTDKWRVSRSILTAKWIKLLLLISTIRKSVFCRFLAEKTNSRFSADLGFKCIFARQESFPVIEWRMGTFVEIGNWILPRSEQNWSSLSFTLFALISIGAQESILHSIYDWPGAFRRSRLQFSVFYLAHSRQALFHA